MIFLFIFGLIFLLPVAVFYYFIAKSSTKKPAKTKSPQHSLAFRIFFGLYVLMSVWGTYNFLIDRPILTDTNNIINLISTLFTFIAIIYIWKFRRWAVHLNNAIYVVSMLISVVLFNDLISQMVQQALAGETTPSVDAEYWINTVFYVILLMIGTVMSLVNGVWLYILYREWPDFR